MYWARLEREFLTCFVYANLCFCSLVDSLKYRFLQTLAVCSVLPTLCTSWCLCSISVCSCHSSDFDPRTGKNWIYFCSFPPVSFEFSSYGVTKLWVGNMQVFLSLSENIFNASSPSFAMPSCVFTSSKIHTVFCVTKPLECKPITLVILLIIQLQFHLWWLLDRP